MSAPRRVGLLGGSFDPVHVGHLHAARAALAARDLDEVRFLPARRSPHKPEDHARPGAERVALLELALADEPRFVVDPRELARGGPSYSIDTVRELAAERPDDELHWILGSDNLAGLPDWRAAEDLLALVQPLVVHRADDPDALVDALRGRLPDALVERLRAGLLRVPPVACSSTELRERLARGEPVGDLLPPGVEARIRARGLYRGKGS